MGIGDSVPWLGRLLRLEVVLAGVCAATPWLLVEADDAGGVRGSISAYHDMTTAMAFYAPLTAAAVLFIVNGEIKEESRYNTVLGVLLFGVLLFDHDGSTRVVHGAAAIGFFVGAVVAMVFWSRLDSRPLRLLFATGIGIAILLWVFVDDVTLFHAESFSLCVIALHYILDATTRVYRVAARGEPPRLAL